MIDGLVRELIQEGRLAKYSFSTSGGSEMAWHNRWCNEPR